MRLTITSLFLTAIALVLFGTIIHLGRKAWTLRLASMEVSATERGASFDLTSGKRREPELPMANVGALTGESKGVSTRDSTDERPNDDALPPAQVAGGVPEEDTSIDVSSVVVPTEEEMNEFVSELVAKREGQQGTHEELVPLTTELPEPLLEGHRWKIELENLEPSEKRQEPLMVPKGLTNLALAKRVTSSDSLPVIGDPNSITDGDKNAADGSYIELSPGKQWVQIDLEQPSRLYGIWLWHFHKIPRAYLDVVVQVSNDPDFARGVLTLYNADHDNSSGFGRGGDAAYVESHRGRVINAQGVRARYLRLHSKGNTSNAMNHYIEVEVWGTE